MRILILNYTFPGIFGPLAQYLVSHFGCEVVFASEFSRRGFSLHGVRHFALKRIKDKRREGVLSAGEEIDFAISRARCLRTSLEQLRDEGFIPEYILASASQDSLLVSREVFPAAPVAGYADHVLPLPGQTLAHEMLVGRLASRSDIFFALSQWQKMRYPHQMQQAVRLFPFAIDTDFFSSGAAMPFVVQGCSDAPENLIVFRAPDASALASPMLSGLVRAALSLSPDIHVAVLCASAEAEKFFLSRVKVLFGDALARIHCYSGLTWKKYRDLLCRSAFYISLKSYGIMYADLLEAMSCGVVPLVAPFPAADEVLRHGENGFFLPRDVSSAMRQLTYLLVRADKMRVVRKAARESVTNFFASSVVLPSHVAALRRLHPAE